VPWRVTQWRHSGPPLAAPLSRDPPSAWGLRLEGSDMATGKQAQVPGGRDGGVPVVDAGWTLRGGTDPDAAALANVLAHRGVTGPDGP
jgi:hypothetical protein